MCLLIVQRGFMQVLNQRKNKLSNSKNKFWILKKCLRTKCKRSMLLKKRLNERILKSLSLIMNLINRRLRRKTKRRRSLKSYLTSTILFNQKMKRSMFKDWCNLTKIMSCHERMRSFKRRRKILKLLKNLIDSFDTWNDLLQQSRSTLSRMKLEQRMTLKSERRRTNSLFETWMIFEIERNCSTKESFHFNKR